MSTDKAFKVKKALLVNDTDFFVSGSKVGVGTKTLTDDFNVAGNSRFIGNLNNNGFSPSFGGSGWKIESNGSAEFQDLNVRGTFSVYELLAKQIRATNGSLLVATSGKADTVDTGNTTITFDTGKSYGHGFVVDDILVSQRLDPLDNELKRTFIKVKTVPNTGSLVYTALVGDVPEAGDEFVRIGNASDVDRRGHIYLTADDNNAPFIGVRDGVSGSAQFTSGTGSIEKVRIGKLNGLSSNAFGDLSGYGLWASGSVYLEGGINSTFGSIGGWNLSSDSISIQKTYDVGGSISTYNVKLDAPTNAGDTVFSAGTRGGETFKITFDGQVTASQALFTGGKIAGFEISGNSIIGDEFTFDASATSNNEYFISSSNFKVEGNGDAQFGEYIVQQANDSTGINAFSRISNTTNIGVLLGKDSNNNGGLIGVATDGDFYIAPIISDVPKFDKEIRFDTSVEIWTIEGGAILMGDTYTTSKLGVSKTPSTPLHIKQNGTAENNGLRLEKNSTTDHWNIRVNTDNWLIFNYNSTNNGGYLNLSNVGQITFTGQHRNVFEDNLSVDTYSNETVGKIVISTGKYSNLEYKNSGSLPSINEALPIVAFSNTENDKRVWGVLSNTPDTDENGNRIHSQGVFVSMYETGSSSENRYIINSLGEGGIWVCNINGSLENGDYITTSNIEGIGMKQNDDLLHNYTVAKITENCDFTDNERFIEVEFSGSIYRKQFVGCTYHCG